MVLNSKDFTVKMEDLTRRKKGKRIYLNDLQTKDLTKKLDEFFEFNVEFRESRWVRDRL